MRTWIVTPVYRDVGSFRILRERLLELKDDDGRPAVRDPHFVVIDDSAGLDEEVAGLRELDDVRVLTPPFNLGHQRGIVYALRKVLPEVGDDEAIVTLDADGEDQPTDLPRLLAPLQGEPHLKQKIALALRTRRRESFAFKVMYRALSRPLPRSHRRDGPLRQLRRDAGIAGPAGPAAPDLRPLLLLGDPRPRSADRASFPASGGERYEGRSKMTYGRLAMHGLRMLMPFTDRIAVRALWRSSSSPSCSAPGWR